MLRSFLTVFVLLLNATAYGATIYDVSCNNINKIRIIEAAAQPFGIASDSGLFYLLDLELKKDRVVSYRKIRDATPTISIRYEGTLFPKEDIQVTANGVPIQNDVPAWTAFADQGITISILRKEDAFAAARAVCPALAPDKVIIDGHWE